MLIVVGFARILHATTRLVKLYEHGGKQHDWYRELAQAVFGACGCLPLPSAAPRPNTLHPVVPDRAARKRATNWLVYLNGGQAALRQHATDPNALCSPAAGKPRGELGGDSLPAHRQHRHLCHVSGRRQPVPAVHLSGHHRRGHWQQQQQHRRHWQQRWQIRRRYCGLPAADLVDIHPQRRAALVPPAA